VSNVELDRLRFDERNLRALLEGPNGPVARDLGQRAVRVETAAKLNATGHPVEGATNPEGRGPKVQSGRLRSSISWRLGNDSDGLYADIGTNVPYGYYLETGLRNGVRYPFLTPALPAAG
jgi:phage gpG-like protein